MARLHSVLLRPLHMAAEQPDLEDNIREFLAKYNRRNFERYQDYSLVIIACCPSEEEPEDEDEWDQNVLLVRANQDATANTTWRLPEIELAELPGSIGINYSIRRIVVTYCNDFLTAPDRFCKLLLSTKIVNATAEPIMKIYSVVLYQQTQKLKNAAGGRGLNLVSMTWLKAHEDRFVGDREDMVSIKSAVNARGVIHDFGDEQYVDD